MGYNIIVDRIENWVDSYKGEPFHALFADPPYHLTSISKRFGKKNSAPAKEGKDGAFSRLSRGFMGEEWDGGDIAFRPETWYAFHRMLHPGAFCMAFASSRGWHRLAVAIEDAGYIIHPTIFLWAQGQGLPKATRIDRQIKDDDELAEAWGGHRYGLQALKPAVEPIIVFQKPYEGRPIENIVDTGAGGLNIDGSRIPHNEEIKLLPAQDIKYFGGMTRKADTPSLVEEGRYPSNFIIGDVEASHKLDEQSGHLQSGKPSGVRKAQNNIYGEYAVGQPITGYGDSGGASRYFYRVQEALDEASSVFYTSKASPSERDAGLDDYEYQVAGGMQARRDGSLDGHITKRRNPHPTVKPIDLNRYLAGLLLPPEVYKPRRLLNPFFGVGSEAIGALMAGWDFVEGIEMSDLYAKIGLDRIKHWCNIKE